MHRRRCGAEGPRPRLARMAPPGHDPGQAGVGVGPCRHGPHRVRMHRRKEDARWIAQSSLPMSPAAPPCTRCWAMSGLCAGGSCLNAMSACTTERPRPRRQDHRRRRDGGVRQRRRRRRRGRRCRSASTAWARRRVRLGVRVGFHFGPVVPRDNDVFGDTVNLASRLCDLASKGQIVTDRGTALLLSAGLPGQPAPAVRHSRQGQGGRRSSWSR
jgi:hypothetical protein